MAMARLFWGAKLTGDEGVDLPYNFAIWMRKVGELARFQQGPLRYNSSFLRFGVCVGERVMLRVVPPCNFPYNSI